jgi:hypothetical protein
VQPLELLSLVVLNYYTKAVSSDTVDRKKAFQTIVTGIFPFVAKSKIVIRGEGCSGGVVLGAADVKEAQQQVTNNVRNFLKEEQGSLKSFAGSEGANLVELLSEAKEEVFDVEEEGEVGSSDASGTTNANSSSNANSTSNDVSSTSNNAISNSNTTLEFISQRIIPLLFSDNHLDDIASYLHRKTQLEKRRKQQEKEAHKGTKKGEVGKGGETRKGEEERDGEREDEEGDRKKEKKEGEAKKAITGELMKELGQIQKILFHELQRCFACENGVVNSLAKSGVGNGVAKEAGKKGQKGPKGKKGGKKDNSEAGNAENVDSGDAASAESTKLDPSSQILASENCVALLEMVPVIYRSFMLHLDKQDFQWQQKTDLLNEITNSAKSGFKNTNKNNSTANEEDADGLNGGLNGNSSKNGGKSGSKDGSGTNTNKKGGRNGRNNKSNNAGGSNNTGSSIANKYKDFNPKYSFLEELLVALEAVWPKGSVEKVEKSTTEGVSSDSCDKESAKKSSAKDSESPKQSSTNVRNAQPPLVLTCINDLWQSAQQHGGYRVREQDGLVLRKEVAERNWVLDGGSEDSSSSKADSSKDNSAKEDCAKEENSSKDDSPEDIRRVRSWEYLKTALELDVGCIELDAAFWERLLLVKSCEGQKHHIISHAEVEARLEFFSALLKKYVQISDYFTLLESLLKFCDATVETEERVFIWSVTQNQNNTAEIEPDSFDRFHSEVAMSSIATSDSASRFAAAIRSATSSVTSTQLEALVKEVSTTFLKKYLSQKGDSKKSDSKKSLTKCSEFVLAAFFGADLPVTEQNCEAVLEIIKPIVEKNAKLMEKAAAGEKGDGETLRSFKQNLSLLHSLCVTMRSLHGEESLNVMQDLFKISSS